MYQKRVVYLFNWAKKLTIVGKLTIVELEPIRNDFNIEMPHKKHKYKHNMVTYASVG